MAQTIWDSAITTQLANNSVNSAECSARIALLQTYCSSLDGGNAEATSLCAQYDNEITALNAQIAKYTSDATTLNNRLYTNYSADEQAALNSYSSLLNDEFLFRNMAISTVSVATLKSEFDAAVQSVSDPNALANAVKKELLIRCYYKLK